MKNKKKKLVTSLIGAGLVATPITSIAATTGYRKLSNVSQSLDDLLNIANVNTFGAIDSPLSSNNVLNKMKENADNNQAFNFEGKRYWYIDNKIVKGNEYLTLSGKKYKSNSDTSFVNDEIEEKLNDDASFEISLFYKTKIDGDDVWVMPFKPTIDSHIWNDVKNDNEFSSHYFLVNNGSSIKKYAHKDNVIFSDFKYIGDRRNVAKITNIENDITSNYYLTTDRKYSLGDAKNFTATVLNKLSGTGKTFSQIVDETSVGNSFKIARNNFGDKKLSTFTFNKKQDSKTFDGVYKKNSFSIRDQSLSNSNSEITNKTKEYYYDDSSRTFSYYDPYVLNNISIDNMNSTFPGDDSIFGPLSDKSKLLKNLKTRLKLPSGVSLSSINFTNNSSDKTARINYTLSKGSDIKTGSFNIQFSYSNKEYESKIVNNDIATSATAIKNYFSKNTVRGKSWKDILDGKGMNKDVLTGLISSHLKGDTEILKASFTDKWNATNPQWDTTSAPIEFTIFKDTKYNGKISKNFSTSQSYDISPFRRLINQSNFSSSKNSSLKGVITLGNRSVNSSLDIIPPKDVGKVNEAYLKKILGTGPYDNPGIKIDNISYSSPSDDEKNTIVTFSISSPSNSQKYSANLIWTKSINKQTIDNHGNASNIANTLDLSGTPLPKNDVEDKSNYSFRKNPNNSIKINDVSGYSFSGDGETNFNVKLDISVGKFTKAIQFPLAFSKSLMNTAVKNLNNVITGGTISVSGSDANTFTINLPNGLIRTELAKKGLKLSYKVSGGTWKESNASSIQIVSWSKNKITEFPNVKMKIELIDVTDSKRDLTLHEEKNVSFRNSNSLPGYIDVDKIDLSSTITGDTHNISVQNTNDIKNSFGSSIAKVVYTISDWKTPENKFRSVGAKASMTKAEFSSLFDGTKNDSSGLPVNLWDVNAKKLLVVKAKIISTNESKYVLSKPKEITVDTSNLLKYVSIENLKNNIVNNLKIDQTGDSHSFKWISNKKSTIDNLAKDLNLKIEYSTDNKNWSTTIPTSTKFAVVDRKIFVRILPLSNKFKSSDISTFDITNQSGIKTIKAYVDVSSVLNKLSDIKLSGSTRISSVSDTPSLPTGSKIIYSLTPNLSNSWSEWNSFTTTLSNNPKSDLRNIKAKFEPIDTAKYLISDTSSFNVNVEAIKNFVDIEDFHKAIKDITYTGVVDRENGIQYSLPSKLEKTSLDSNGIKLQYKLLGDEVPKWTDYSDGNVSANTANGITGTVHGALITVKKEMNGNVRMTWRLIPISSYQGINKSTIIGPTPQEYEDQSKVIISNKSEVMIEDKLENLPSLAITSAKNLGDITISGTTDKPQLDEKIDGKTYSSYLSLLNPGKPDYSSIIVPIYSVKMQSQSQRIWFEKDDLLSWLSDTLSSNRSVWYGNSLSSSKIKTSDLHPDWNKIYNSEIQVKWISKDRDKLLATDMTPKTIKSSDLSKFIYVDSWLNSLKTMNITGDTHELKDYSNKINSTLDSIKTITDTTAGDFVVEVTTTFVGSNPDWTKKVVLTSSADFNANVKMDHSKKIAFRIAKKDASSKYKLRLKLERNLGELPVIEWGKGTAKNILKWIEADNNILKTDVSISGDTKNLVESIKQDVIRTNIDGILSSVGEEGIDIEYRLKQLPDQNINQNWRTFEAFRAWIKSGSRNAPKFDGKWGKEKIEARIVPLSGFKFDASKQSATSVNTSKLNRFVDVTSLINDIKSGGNNSLRLKGDGNTKWWNKVNGEFTSKIDSNGKTWDSYIDNKSIYWDEPSVNPDWHVVVKYTTKSGTTSESDWSTTPPKELPSSGKILRFKIVFDGTDFTPGEISTPSDKAIYDIKNVTGIDTIPTKVDVPSSLKTKLSSIKITGDNNNIEINNEPNVPSNSSIVYSLTDFMSLRSGGSSNTKINSFLTSMNLSRKNLEDASYKEEMTASEFINFVNSLKRSVGTGYNKNGSFIRWIGILRKFISVRIKADIGYSIPQENILNITTKPNVANIYTYRNINEFTKLLTLKEDGNKNSGIHIQGQKTTEKGAAVFLPETLFPENLTKYGLKLQWTTSSTDGTSFDQGNAIWNDAEAKQIVRDPNNGISWSEKGFKLTITPKKNNNAYLAMRIIPIQDEEKTVNISSLSTSSSITDYFNLTKVHLYENSSTLAKNLYGIDTSKIPTVVKTDSNSLLNLVNKIEFTGTTHNVKIKEDRKEINKIIDDLNDDKSLKKYINIFYSIDLDDSNLDIWLKKDEMEAYMNGGLELKSNKVYFSNSNVEIKALSKVKRIMPNYNNLNFQDFKVRFGEGLDGDNKRYIPSDSKPIKVLATKGTLKKWIDVTKQLDDLKKMIIKGDTNHLVYDSKKSSYKNYILEVKDDVFNKTKIGMSLSNNPFVVETTYKFRTSTNPDWTNLSVDKLEKLDFDKRVAFRIKEKIDSNFFVSSSASPSEEIPFIIWDQNSKNDILINIKVNSADLKDVKLTGNTKGVTVGTNAQLENPNGLSEEVKLSLIKSDKEGNMDGSGSIEGVDVWYSLTGTTGGAGGSVNTNPMPFKVFNAYLAGELQLNGTNGLKINGFNYKNPWKDTNKLFGFNSTNIVKPTFDGTWGREKFRVSYHAIPGYNIDTGQNSLQQPNVDKLKRFINIDNFVANLKDENNTNGIKTLGDGKTHWWNTTTGSFDTDALDSNGKNWGSYIDSKNLTWNKINISNLFKVKLQFSTKSSPRINNNSDWTDTLQKTITDRPSDRFIKFKIVPNGSYSGSGDNAEIADFSIANMKIKDVTDSSAIREVPINVKINSNVNLANIELNSNTNNLPTSKIEDATSNSPSNTTIVYTLTKFKELDGSDSGITKRLTDLGFTLNELKDAGYKSMMDKNEFSIFVKNMTKKFPKGFIKEGSQTTNNLKVLFKGLIKDFIEVTLRANKNYSILQSDLTKLRSIPKIDKLYTFRDIKELVDQIENISLLGRKSTKLGVAVSIPSAITPDALKKYNIKLQWTTSSPDGKVIGKNPTWMDVKTVHIPKDSNAGINDIPTGFRVTITPKAGNYAFLAFRFVPIDGEIVDGKLLTYPLNNSDIENTSGTMSDVVGKTTSWKLDKYIEKTKTKLFISQTKEANNGVGDKFVGYKVDTRGIPTVIKTESKDLASIEWTGDTRHVKIHEDLDGSGIGAKSIMTKVDALNPDDTTLKTHLKILYAIDKTDGSPIGEDEDFSDRFPIDQTTPDIIWLDKENMEAYLNGKLSKSGPKIYNSVTNKEIPQLTERYSKHKFYLAKYKNLNINFIYSRFKAVDVSKTERFIPSDSSIVKVKVNPGVNSSNSFRKWLDGKEIIKIIKKNKVYGNTQNNKTWTLDSDDKDKNVQYISNAELEKLDLKIQFSFDGVKWTTREEHLFDNFTKIINRHVYIRVLPNDADVNGIKHSENEIHIDYGSGELHAEADISSLTSDGHRNFLIYMDIDKDILSQVKMSGNTYKIMDESGDIPSGLDETVSAGSTGVDPTDYISDNHLEIQYLYNGNWYNKNTLLTKMKELRDEPKDAELSLPTDFTHSKVEARWHILNKKDAIIKDGIKNGEESLGHSAPFPINTENLRTFINIWGTQTSAVPSDFVFGRGKGISQTDKNIYFTLSGSINAINLSWDSSMYKWFTENNLRVQWSNKANPDNKVNSSDWKESSETEGTKKNTNDIAEVALNPKEKSFWIRFIPIDNKPNSESKKWFISSQTVDAVNKQIIVPIKIDTSQLKFEVTADNKALAVLQLGTSANKVDTQDNFDADETPFLSNNFNGVTPKTADADGNIVDVPENEIEQWSKDVGLTIKYKIVQTRKTKSTSENKEVIYSSLDKLKYALKEKHINFDRDSLRVRFGIDPSHDKKYTVKDKTWQKPSNLSNIVNIVYPEDVYKLESDTYDLGGNTIVTRGTLNTKKYNGDDGELTDAKKATDSALAKLGLKIIWTSDASNPNEKNPSKVNISNNPGWKDSIVNNFKKLPEHKGIWAKYAPLNENYKIAIDDTSIPNSGTADQLTKLDSGLIKVAIILDSNYFNKFNTTHFDETSTTEDPVLIGQPSLPTTSLTEGKFKYQYAITKNKPEDIIWKDEIGSNKKNEDGILIDTYGTGVVSLDKDREKSITLKLIINDDNKYEFTDPKGMKVDDKKISRTIDIDPLIQPIYIDIDYIDAGRNDSDLLLPTLPDSDVNTTWKDFADNGKFQPSFTRGKTSQNANLISFAYDNENIDSSTKKDIYSISQNPFDKNDFPARNVITSSLAPRHTHFEFKVKSVGAKNFSAAIQTKSVSDNLPTSTTDKTLQAILVADEGYELAKGQEWQRDFNVVLVSRTKDLAIRAIKEGEKALRFIGFETDDGAAKIALDNSKNPNKGNPDLVFSRYSKDPKTGDYKGKQVSDKKSLFKNEAFSLEYNVVDARGREVVWKDQTQSKSDRAYKGWHKFSEAPDVRGFGKEKYIEEGGKYGRYPVSLKNGERVLIRLRANNGWVIIDDYNKEREAKIPNTDNYLAYSHVLTYDQDEIIKGRKVVIEDAIVRKLPKVIIIPEGMTFYNESWLRDEDNSKLTNTDPDYPTVKFTGSDGKGVITIKRGNLGDVSTKTKAKIQILRPWRPEELEGEESIFDFNTLKPLLGYKMRLQDPKTNKVTWKIVAKTSAGISYTKEVTNDEFDATIAIGETTYIKDADLLENSWFDPADINDLSGGDAVRVRLDVIDKDEYAFQYEGQRGKWDELPDIWIPKYKTRQLFNKGKDYDAEDRDPKYVPIYVAGLRIKPPIEPDDKSKLKLVYTKSDEREKGKLKYTAPYKNHAQVALNIVAKATDKWEWVYSKDDIDGIYNTSLGNDNNNGDVIYVKARIKGSSGKVSPFKFDSSFKNRPGKYVISGLKDMVNTVNIPRPIITFGGYQGKATITSIEENKTSIKNLSYDEPKDGNLPLPLAGVDQSGKQIDTMGGFKWQFQVSRSNPENLSSNAKSKLEWSDENPQDLRVGNYVRMRLTPINSVAKVEPELLSYNKVQAIDTDGNIISGKFEEGNEEGWTRVNNLLIDGNNIVIKPRISGFDKKTNLTIQLTSKSPDEAGVTMEASFATSTDWHELSYFTSLTNFENLDGTTDQNGKIQFRAIAKDGYVIPGKDANKEGEEIYFSGKSIDGKDIKYIQLPDWKDYEISGLKGYINVDAVSIKDVEIIRDKGHPSTDELAKQKAYVGFNDEDILSGNATIIPENFSKDAELDNDLSKWLERINKITDINGQPASDKILVKFTVSKFDPYSGQVTESPLTDKIPQALSNRDKVKIIVRPKDVTKYKLSNSSLDKTITIKDLVQPPPELGQPPAIQFRGEDGEGTVSITPAAPRGFTWYYQIWRKNSKEPEKYIGETPQDLSNGDKVRVKIASAISGIKIKQDYETAYSPVTNLITTIDLSKFVFESDDKLLKVDGTQEMSATIKGKQPRLLRDIISNKGVPFPSKLEWRFYITTDKNDIPTDPNKYLISEPSNIQNTMFVRGVLKSIDQKYKVQGFSPVSIEIKGLEPKASISGKLSTILIIGGVSVVVVGVIIGGIFIFKSKKKRVL